MAKYRLEEASTGRAGCQNKECKDQKIKILKGELRLGSWVDTERFQSFFWRHWGCVTPKIIASLNETIEESSGSEEDKDYTVLDGYDELSAENQEKVRQALEQGHVDDSDWKGDIEMNRPGKTGFRTRTPKKKNAGAEEEDEEEEKPQPKKRGRKKAEKEDTEEAAPKRAKRGGRKRADAEETAPRRIKKRE
ncbi:hypothetical protein MAP00_007499 [Monascus purpureus]|nr:hypothetical protein MAP00_007499 [Monascus purpureus]